MDGLSAVGLASNILQFVDFASTLVGKGIEIYNSAEGSSLVHGDLRSSVSRLQALSTLIQSQPLIPRDKDEIEIVKIASQCHDLGAELRKALEGLAATPNSWSSSAWKALQSVWSQPKIDDMAMRLEMCRNDLHLHLSKALLDQQSFMQRSMEDLKSNNESLGLKSDHMMARFQYLKEDLLDALKPTRTDGINTIASTLMTQKKLGALYSGGEDIVRAADMLRALKFSRMTVRRFNVVDRYRTTFDWIFDHMHAEQELHFRDWLANGNGIYWVTGNPGSGKSTLMKFVYLDPRTKQYLLRWARNSSAKNLIMADFFFWKPGTKLERSQEGFLRGILYEVLRLWPEVMPQVLGERWHEWIVDRPWTLNELRAAIDNLGPQQESHTKFCFFVDGLDEYEGQSHEIAQTVLEIAKSPNIKVCVSSRPWNVFESSFGSQPKAVLRVHEHTQEDIRLYVHEVLGQHKVYKQLEAEDAQYERVLQKIVHKAKGVFLWVFLVVRNLEEVLPNEDTVESLEQTVDEFPSELEFYFERMLDSIASRYHEQSAVMLSMMMDSENLLPLVLVVHVTAQSDKAGLQVSPPSDKRIHSSRKLRARLKAYCGDLVTIVTAYHDGFEDIYQHVDFLHRTVDDFLRSPSVRDKIRQRLPTSFNPSLAIVECSISYVRSKPSQLAIEHPVVELLLGNASRLESAQMPCDLGLLDKCKTALVESRVPAEDFMEAAISNGLFTYVDERIEGPDFDATRALIYVLFNNRIKLHQGNRMVLRMLCILFEHGADPNASMTRCRDEITRHIWIKHTVWTAKAMRTDYVPRYIGQPSVVPHGRAPMLASMNAGKEKEEKAKMQHDASICEVFLEYGAAYDADVRTNTTARAVLERTFRDSPDQVRRFEQIVRRRRRQGMSWIAELSHGASFPTGQGPTLPEKKYKRRSAFSRLFSWRS